MASSERFKSLWGRVAARTGGSAAVPEDTRLYGVGDIHGRADLLNKMLDLIAADMRLSPAKNMIEVYIGDYMDRGPHSREVIEFLCTARPLGTQRVCLKGNHEQIFLDFLADPTVISSWMGVGGLETLLSYGLRPKLSLRPSEVKEIHSGLLDCLPKAHERFIRELRLTYTCGDYFFVHGGVRPGVSLNDQMPDDLLWIREPFLSSIKNFGAVVVHGHTPVTAPVILPNRICIDTGAYVTGVLTCLVLQGQEQRFLSASL
jgi:serine/threonine protein phosphatase 1